MKSPIVLSRRERAALPTRHRSACASCRVAPSLSTRARIYSSCCCVRARVAGAERPSVADRLSAVAVDRDMRALRYGCRDHMSADVQLVEQPSSLESLKQLSGAP